MIQLFQKKPEGKKIVFHIGGMHCVSCSMNIDGELEEMSGVLSSTTNYPSAKTTIFFDEKKISPEKIRTVIEKLGYTATS